MKTTITGTAKKIFDQIEALYIEQVGPIAAVLVDEALETWIKEMGTLGRKPSLRNIPSYLAILEKDISNEKDRKVFINAVFDIKALEHYKQYYEGEL